jgi:hypothetical protein
VRDGAIGWRRGMLPALFGIIVILGADAAGQAVVVKDELCGLFDAQKQFVFGAPGLSTLAPNGVLHLVCHVRVPAPGVPVRFEPADSFDYCGIEGNFTSTWEERISPSGEAILECWVNPGRGSRPNDSASTERVELDRHAEHLDQ